MFLKHRNHKQFTPEDGDIKVCFDRWPNPENLNYCKDLKRGENGEFKISNPCKGKSLSSCEPFYFTVWGKDRTTNTQCSGIYFNNNNNKESLISCFTTLTHRSQMSVHGSNKVHSNQLGCAVQFIKSFIAFDYIPVDIAIDFRHFILIFQIIISLYLALKMR